jgi:replication fork protection complex subunit Tof1/Swi1
MALEMMQGMDELTETELQEAIANLGNWHKVDGKLRYLVNKDECLTCLKDIEIALKQDNVDQGFMVHLKLGEWKVVSDHLIPLFIAYREEPIISSVVLKVLVRLTRRVDVFPNDKRRLLQHLQDYKEAFVKKDVFIIIMGMLVESLDEEDDTEQPQIETKEKQGTFEDVLTLIGNLMCTPDPNPGDAGYTPLRAQLQVWYIRHFHTEGVLDFLQLFAEQLEADHNVTQAWILVEILYHIVTQVDPEGILKSRKEKDKKVMAQLLEKAESHARLSRAPTSRHARFGTVMQHRDAVGGATFSASVSAINRVSKGSKVWGRDFKNSYGSENKQNMFHDPFFVDLEEGSVKEHNQINPHLRQANDSAHDLGESVCTGLSKFFHEFVQTSFSSLVSLLRGTVLSTTPASGVELRMYGRQTLLNFISWVLEFHRHDHFMLVSKAKANKEQAPIIDIAAIQGALDLDMIQFVASRLREYGKDANIHSSFLLLVLRTLSQQLKTIDVVVESQDKETRDCGEVLTLNIVKEDVMGNLVWILKNFKSSSHDPRVLTYAVDNFHIMIRLMKNVVKRHGKDKAEFQIERLFGQSLRRASTTVEAEIESLADASVIENLFHLLEKYKRHSSQLNSMLVHLIYSIIKASPANIVVFFELSYFIRIHRIWSDPLVRDKREGQKFKEMVELLRYILRQFFKCAERNKCVFVELLFRKTFEKTKEALLESRTSEFEAILDNYEDEGYSKFLDRMRQGEDFSTMRSRQKQLHDGNLPWTEEEDNKLRERYPVYADHPMCADLLNSELSMIESNRTAKAVKKRLGELGLLVSRASRTDSGFDQGNEGQNAKVGEEDGEPPTKKLKTDAAEDMDLDRNAGDDLDSLELDLERLLDAAMDSMPQEDTVQNNSASSSSGGIAKAASTMVDPDADTPPNLDLELELEAMMEDSGLFGEEIQSAAPTQAENPPSAAAASTPKESSARKNPSAESKPAPATQEEDTLENELDALLSSQPDLASQPAPQPSQASATVEDDLEAMLGEAMGDEPASQPKDASDDGADADEQQFWEDAVQTEQKIGGTVSLATPARARSSDATSQQEASPGSAMLSQLSQESTIEGALERIVEEAEGDEAMSQCPGNQEATWASHLSQESSIEAALERIIDDASV